MTLSLISSTLSRTAATELPTVERYVYGNQRTQLNRLNGSMTTTTTSMTVGFDLDGIRPGAVVEVDDEAMYVWSVSGSTATVQRAFLGTTAASHVDLSLVRVEPRFLRALIADEIVKEMRSWPTNIYARYAGELSLASAAQAVDLAGLSGVSGVHLIRCQYSPLNAQEDRWLRLDGARIERRQDTTDFPSGYALISPAEPGRDVTLRVTVRAPFQVGALSSSTDLGSLGITHDLADIIPWGVASRLVKTRDVPRSDSNAQGRSRPAEEVRPGDAMQIGAQLRQERDRLLVEAANRLLAEDGMGWA